MPVGLLRQIPAPAIAIFVRSALQGLRLHLFLVLRLCWTRLPCWCLNRNMPQLQPHPNLMKLAPRLRLHLIVIRQPVNLKLIVLRSG